MSRGHGFMSLAPASTLCIRIQPLHRLLPSKAVLMMKKKPSNKDRPFLTTCKSDLEVLIKSKRKLKS